tara:strand:- start:3837 stop:4784 length:948 start_codon:yes stop_codon:yes gene_type:complete
MAFPFDSSQTTDIIVGGNAAKRHRLKIRCSSQRKIVIKKLWIDNYNTNLSNPDSPYLMQNYATIGAPKMKYFPFFLDPTWSIEGNSVQVEYLMRFGPSNNNEFIGISAPQGVTPEEHYVYVMENFWLAEYNLSFWHHVTFGGHDFHFPYDIPQNVGSGVITHPLDRDFEFAGYHGWNSPGYLTNAIRDNYRLHAQVELGNAGSTVETSDSLNLDVIFAPSLIDNYSGKLSIHYWAYTVNIDPNYTGPYVDVEGTTGVPVGYLIDEASAEFKTFEIYLTGAINKSNIKEVDYQDIEFVSDLDGVNLEDPYLEFELG